MTILFLKSSLVGLHIIGSSSVFASVPEIISVSFNSGLKVDKRKSGTQNCPPVALSTHTEGAGFVGGSVGDKVGGVGGPVYFGTWRSRFFELFPANPEILPETARASSSLCAAALLNECFSNKSAATPATCGVAMEVPLMVSFAVLDPFHADVIEVPGAYISVHLPKFENEERRSLESVEPTDITPPFAALPPARAGEYLHPSLESFPEATTTICPALAAARQASSILFIGPPPNDKESTLDLVAFLVAH
mmetsp:Transcript_12032/g.19585  ORF Transcript_12032/g.19585 Transcript_12032/m.19585 type:complete len:250 (-) Transcript_12032:279-1028(-)|eukprot:CAMPEP_0203751012 /NCGR_PEP_ID=MMETSP0098-20131031/5149_1 /ASSEMBLY_ACC=CAM_ASM_000208 /TAXON_ID=96639 /ORGANISM=" , Strain NY0313808BC1" /LENGTH=249 /DNA_ID=CAMNT_0050640537 /DNA_START=608 /DNA_END=1357 /DNA_ORIENTATION=+